MYDDIAFVIRNSKKNKWLKSFSGNRAYWVDSIINAQLCNVKTANKLIDTLQKTSHAKHVQIREIGILD